MYELELLLSSKPKFKVCSVELDRRGSSDRVAVALGTRNSSTRNLLKDNGACVRTQAESKMSARFRNVMTFFSRTSNFLLSSLPSSHLTNFRKQRECTNNTHHVQATSAKGCPWIVRCQLWGIATGARAETMHLRTNWKRRGNDATVDWLLQSSLWRQRCFLVS